MDSARTGKGASGAVSIMDEAQEYEWNSKSQVGGQTISSLRDLGHDISVQEGPST